ncbi:MAG TPA: 50S ribosomal protein L6 [Candidatus Azoamicus sp. MARI]
MHNRINTLSKITIPDNINIKFDDNNCYISGKNGQIKHKLNKYLNIINENNILTIQIKNTDTKEKELKKIYALINTTKALFKNYITGIQQYYEKHLILKGIGYKAELNNNKIKLHIGFSIPINIEIPSTIKVEINSNINITIKGISKEEVGQFAANIRLKRKPEIYKGNGIKYKNEIIKFKSPKKSK